MNRILNKIVWLIALITVFNTKSYTQVIPDDYTKVKFVVDSIFPEITGYTLDSVKINADFFSGKVTVVNFSAPSCPPCRFEYKYLNSFVEEFEDNDSFNILGIYPLNRYGLENYINSLKPEKPSNPLKLSYSNKDLPAPEYQVLPECDSYDHNLRLCSTISQKFNIHQYPLTLIIDKKGILRHMWKGFALDQESATDVIDNWKELITQYINE